MNRKIEIIDDQIRGCYKIISSTYNKMNWLGKIIGWKLESELYLSHKYRCPEIAQGILTIKEYFDREVGYALEDDDIVEVHRTIIQNK